MDPERKSFGERGLPDPGLANEDRVVLASTRKNMDCTVELGTPANQGIELALGSALGEIRREGGQGIGRHTLTFLATQKRRCGSPTLAGSTILTELRFSVADISQQVKARDALGTQQGHRMGVRLLKNRDDQVADLDLLLFRTIRMVHGVLDHTMKREGLHCFNRVVTRHRFEVFIEESLDLGAQSVDVGARMAQDPSAIVRMNQGVEEMFDRQISVAPHDGLAVCRLEGHLQVAPD